MRCDCVNWRGKRIEKMDYGMVGMRRDKNDITGRTGAVYALDSRDSIGILFA